MAPGSETPAPQLLGGMSNYTDSQLFWTIKHGIRNTGMPAWGSMLSDDEIWQLVSPATLISARHFGHYCLPLVHREPHPYLLLAAASGDKSQLFRVLFL
jgi:hypothetical protein